jgi:cytosine/adenosine deaminase-related metal-dependent hydrolase
MPETILLHGSHLLTDPRLKSAGLIADGAVAITDGLVAETGRFAELRSRHPHARVLGNGTQLLLPGLVDAHSHGRGISPIQKGVRNDFLENALFDWAYMPVLPPELTAALCAWRHLRSGCTTLHHNGFDDDGAEGARRAHTAIRTYLATGIRLAFSPGLRDESKLVMGGDAFFATLPDDLRGPAKILTACNQDDLIEQYFQLFDDLYVTYHNADTRILLAPCWAHGASEDFLRRVRDASDSHGGALVHMHLLQSPVQKAWGLRRNGKPTIQWLDDLGLMDRRMAFGHAIWVTEDDIALMGDRQVNVTTHPSCNFHMRNGITPVMAMRAAGINVAMGMDDKTINDDEDAVMELRMMHKVHRLSTFNLRAPPMDAYEALETATVNAGRASGFEGEVGALLPGWKGDAILVDLDRVARDPWIDPGFDLIEAFVERALGSDVHTVVVGGRVCVENHIVTSIDVPALSASVRAFCASGLPPAHKARADLLARIKPYMQDWYANWTQGVLDAPFYRVNSRT